MQKPLQQRPVPAKTDLSLVASSPNERNTLARLDGPQREALDCQESSCLNDVAAGNFHARSTALSAWITDSSIASGLTVVRPYDNSRGAQGEDDRDHCNGQGGRPNLGF